jgi:hypothetical protein
MVNGKLCGAIIDFENWDLKFEICDLMVVISSCVFFLM